MTAYPTYPVPGPGYYDDSYYNYNFYAAAPAPGYHFDYQYTTSYGPPPEDPYAYYHPQPPPPRPATAFQSKRPQSSYQHESYGWEQDGREPYDEDQFSNEDRGEDDFKSRFSPRFHSNGNYATATIKPCRLETRPGPRRMRSFSTSHPIPGIDSDDESRIDDYGIKEPNDANFHFDRKAPRRPKKKSYNYRGQGRARNHKNEERVEEEEEEDEEGGEEEEEEEHIEVPTQERHSRQRTRSSKFHSRAASATPRRSHGARPVTPRQGRRPHAKATDEDRHKHRFPPHYSLEFWDPAESPIILLGNVFDANSLGKWIYDWTSYCYSTGSPTSEVAGELWCLLIILAGKVKRAEECYLTTRSDDSKDLLQDFISSGERLHVRLQEILELCEKPMLSVGEDKGKSHRLGMNAGIMFVETIFGPDQLLVMTEKFMHSIRLWNLRFDANCGEICSRKKKN